MYWQAYEKIQKSFRQNFQNIENFEKHAAHFFKKLKL